VICSQHFFFGWDLLFFFRPPSDPLQIRFIGLEIRVHFSDSPTPKVCHQDYSFTADPLSRFRFGKADLFRCSSRTPGIRVLNPLLLKRSALAGADFFHRWFSCPFQLLGICFGCMQSLLHVRQFWLDFSSLSVQVQVCVNRCREKLV
jgi:hypothetical protein